MNFSKEDVEWFINQTVKDKVILTQLCGFQLGDIQDGSNPLNHTPEAIKQTSRPFKLLMEVLEENTGGNYMLNRETKRDEKTGDTYETGSLSMNFKGLYHKRSHNHAPLGIKKPEDYVRKKTMGKFDKTLGTVDNDGLKKIADCMEKATKSAKKMFKKVHENLFMDLFHRMVAALNNFVPNQKSGGKVISFHKNCQGITSIKKNTKTDVNYASINYFAMRLLKDMIYSKQAQKVIDWVAKLCDTYLQPRDLDCICNIFSVDLKEPIDAYERLMNETYAGIAKMHFDKMKICIRNFCNKHSINDDTWKIAMSGKITFNQLKGNVGCQNQPDIKREAAAATALLMLSPTKNKK